MIQIEFTEEDMKALNHERYHHPHPSVQRKMEVLWLKAHGLAHDEIVKLADVSPNTIRSYFRDYAEGGIEKLKEVNFYQPQSDLVAHQNTLEEHFRKNPPATIKEAAHEIEALTGIIRSETQVRAFITAMGMKCRSRHGSLQGRPRRTSGL
jgi:transposase